MLPAGFAKRGLDHEKQRALQLRTPCQDSAEYEEIDDEMEFEHTILCDEDEEYDEEIDPLGQTNGSKRLKDEILDSTVSDVTA